MAMISKNNMQQANPLTESEVDAPLLANVASTAKVYREADVAPHIYYACCSSRLGGMMMAATEKGICFVQFAEHQSELLAQLKKEFPQASLTRFTGQQSVPLDRWMEALNAHISTDAPRPDLPLHISGTAFQIRVWQCLLTLNEGELCSYGEVATQLGTPNASRAVGSACGKNRIAVLIPCHRVLRGDGGLGGYRWGLDRKRALLAKEQAES